MDLRAPGIWRARDARVFDFLQRFTATREQISRFFTGRTLDIKKKKASRWIKRQLRRKRIRLIGILQLKDTGRPALVYGRRCQQHQIEHEIRVTEFAILMDSTLERGVKAGRTEPDGLMIREETRFWIEIDNSGKMDAKQMQAKWKRFEGVDGFILVVAVTEERMQRLRKGAELVKNIALFTTFDRLRAGLAWIDWYGKTTNI